MTQLFPPPRPVTSSPSMSIYVPASNPVAIAKAVKVGDAICVSGKAGPATIRRLRAQGIFKPVIFDGLGYTGDQPMDPDGWALAQAQAGADRIILPGVYLDWDATGSAELERTVREQSVLAAALGATALIAFDARWLTKRYTDLTDALASMGCPVAIVLADPRDPLATGTAVEGLRWMCHRIPELLVLRCDHGAIGAVASGAVHGSIGVRGSHRHLVPPAKKGGGKPSRSARVFVPSLVDWFLAETLASWDTVSLRLTCDLDCCRGDSVARYFDDDLDADWHNMCALSDLADTVLDAERQDQSRVFIDLCAEATGLYGLAGMHGPVDPKAQLEAWAFL